MKCIDCHLLPLISGTHYISSALFGGRARSLMRVESSYYNTSSSFQVQTNSKISFHKMKGGIGGGVSKNAASEAFSSSTVHTVNLVGGQSHAFFLSFFLSFHFFLSRFTCCPTCAAGDPSLQDINNWSAWVDSIHKLPALVRYRVRPISDLVPPSLTQIRLNLDRATVEYAAQFANKTAPVPLGINMLTVGYDCVAAPDEGLACPTKEG